MTSQPHPIETAPATVPPQGTRPSLAVPQRSAPGASTNVSPAPASESAKPAIHTSPPRPLLAFRVGVTGHRPEPADLPRDQKKRCDPDVPSICAVAADILRTILCAFNGVADTNPSLFEIPRAAATYGPKAPLRLVSSLAEGADQWVADEAQKLGYE